MSRICDNTYTFTQLTTTSSKPNFSDVNTNQVEKDYSDYIRSTNYEIHVTENLVPRKETSINTDGNHTVTVWDNHKQIEIINHPLEPNLIVREENSDWTTPEYSAHKGTIWEIHQKTIHNILNNMAHNELAALHHLPFEKKRICLGHWVYNGLEIRGKNKRRKVQKLSGDVNKVYKSDLGNYKNCITYCTGLEDDNPKVRFSAQAYHVDNHKACDAFEIQLLPDQIGLQKDLLFNGEKKKMKKCLGHAEYLYTFPDNSKALAALRALSDQKLKEFGSTAHYKNSSQGYLKTHTFKRQGPPYPQRDLFIFFQHQDNHEGCSQYCYLPLITVQQWNVKQFSVFDAGILEKPFEKEKKQIFLDIYAPQRQPASLNSNLVTNEQECLLQAEYKKKQANKLEIEIAPSKLKNFPNCEEALLRLPLELDEDALPFAEPQPYYRPSQVASCGEKKCSHGDSFFINGVLNTYEQGLETTGAISEMQNGNTVHLIYNSTLGIHRDLIKQKYINNDYLIPAGKLLKDQIIHYFENAPLDQVLHIDAHSQGGAILNKILPEIPHEFRKRMYVDTYGTAGYIDADMAKRVRNIWHPHDVISKKADPKGWKKAKEDGSLVILENDGKSALEAHSLMYGYFESLQENNKQFALGVF